jgi:hypothetical protein
MLEIQGPDIALLDDRLELRARGAGSADALLWQARMRDDDGLVWRARAERPEDLPGAWRGKRQHAALASLRPVRIEVRAQAPDGRAASRTLTRLLAGQGVRIRRWRDGPQATLHLPEGEPRATVLVDGPAPVAAALLASRGLLVLAVAGGDIGAARERLEAVPGASAVQELSAGDVPWPAGTPGADAAAWDALLARLDARPR